MFIISSVNFITQEIAIANNITVSLKPATGVLNEVVVVAYGQMVKKNTTGSIAAVKSSDLENKPFSSVDKTLQGQVAGLQSSSFSGAPGSFTDIRIRGVGSITANSNPLWVIDGAIALNVDPTSQSTTANTLSTLNPDDIESITVLKDAASASIYGSRAANGVILVTTKKGKAGKTVFNFTAGFGANSIAYYPANKPLNSIQTQTLLRESLINAGYATDDASADAIITDPDNGLGINPDYTNINTDWLDVVSRSGNQQQYNLSLTGGNSKTQFYASAGLFKQEGVVIATDFKRYNGSLSITHKANNKLTFSANLNGSATNQNIPPNGGQFSNPVLSQLFLLPWYTPYNADGSFKYNDPEGEFPPSSGGLYNPVIEAAWNTNNSRQVAIRGSVSGAYNILKNLTLTSRYSGEYFDVNENLYWNPFYGDGYSFGGAAQGSYTREYDWTWSNFADYKRVINASQDVYFNIKAGYEAYEANTYLLQAGGQSFPLNLQLQYLASSANPVGAYSQLHGNATNSLFSLGDFNYKGRYVLSASFRRDASSRFGANHKWGNFYSVGGAWNINEENFLVTNQFINTLKLRASYGTSGNQAIGNYTALETFGYGFNYAGNPGSGLTNVGNPDLSWEKNAIFNTGIDFGLFKNSFYGTIEYYNRKTSDLILAVPLSLTTGVVSQNRNVGTMINKGLELTLGGKPISTKNFTWDISMIFSYNKNKVTQLYLDNPFPIPNEPFTASVGHDVHEFYAPLWAGVNPEDGTPRWYTDSSQSATTGDYNQAQFALSGKSASPKYFGSFKNTFTYKGFSLQIEFYYNFGNYINGFWNTVAMTEGAYLGTFNQLTDELSAWQKPGDKTDIPQIIFGGNNNSNQYSTRYLYRGDYIRLRNAELSYSIPITVLKRLHISHASLYMRGTNLLTFGVDKHLPYDPEQGIISTANLEIYIPKTITGGIKIEF
jgi:TonB-linked SusC/RagA family outer membrane protein